MNLGGCCWRPTVAGISLGRLHLFLAALNVKSNFCILLCHLFTFHFFVAQFFAGSPQLDFTRRQTVFIALDTSWTMHAYPVLPVPTSRGLDTGRARCLQLRTLMPEFFNFSIGSSRSTILFYVQASLLSPVPFMGRFRAYRFHAFTMPASAATPFRSYQCLYLKTRIYLSSDWRSKSCQCSIGRGLTQGSSGKPMM